MLEMKLLFLIGIANGAPILARRIIGARFRYPLDFNKRFWDGRPFFGQSKTFIGVASSFLLTVASAILIGFDVLLGLLVAGFSMLGDLCSSFTKRRLNMPVHARATGLDQIPESLFPSLAFAWFYPIGFDSVMSVVGSFLIIEILLSKILYRFKIRRRPY